MGSLIRAKELSAGVVVALISWSEKSDRHASVWLLDFQKMNFQRLTEKIKGMENYMSLSGWKGGVVIHIATSPGEAVGNDESIYIDASRKIVGKTLTGDYNRNGSLEAEFDDNHLTASFVFLKDRCEDFNAEEEGRYFRYTPTTTMDAIDVNGKSVLLPHPLSVECDLMYGGSYAAPQFPRPTFDGRSVVFHVPGYEVGIRVIDGVFGSVSFIPKFEYYVPQHENYEKRQLVGENEYGVFIADDNIWDDPLLLTLKQKTKEGMFFEALGPVTNGIVSFKVQTFVYESNTDKEVATVDYNVTAKKFQNLHVIESATSTAAQ
jgi:hypothetical protein